MNEKDYTGIRCPSCGAGEVVPILYGLPTAEVDRAAEAGKVVLGGCVVRVGMPDHHCQNCGHECQVAVER